MPHHETGTKDATYDLVSILYHALQGAEVYGKYKQDAEQAGDKDLGTFFGDIQEEEKQRANRAKDLLKSRLDKETTH